MRKTCNHTTNWGLTGVKYLNGGFHSGMSIHVVCFTLWYMHWTRVRNQPDAISRCCTQNCAFRSNMETGMGWATLGNKSTLTICCPFVWCVKITSGVMIYPYSGSNWIHTNQENVEFKSGANTKATGEAVKGAWIPRCTKAAISLTEYLWHRVRSPPVVPRARGTTSGLQCFNPAYSDFGLCCELSDE